MSTESFTLSAIDARYSELHLLAAEYKSWAKVWRHSCNENRCKNL